MIVAKKFGNRLKELRTRQGYSQETFAKKTGIHRTYIASIETGKRNVSIVNLEKIAEGLNITISELLDFDKPNNNTILLKIENETFLLESKQELSLNIINEIEILCHSANDEDSEFNEIRKRDGCKDELSEMSVYEIAKIFQKVVLEKLNVKVIFKPINLEVKVWL